MTPICEHLKANVSEILLEWERLMNGDPRNSFPVQERDNSMPDALLRLVHAALGAPHDLRTQRQHVAAASAFGQERRRQGRSVEATLSEYHLLRQAIWNHLLREVGVSERAYGAIIRVDRAITSGACACLWGYHRRELEALEKWEEGIDAITRTAAST